MVEELKSRFPRNYNIEKKEKEWYNSIEKDNIIFKNKNHKDIFMMALALGYKNKVSEKLRNSYPLINCSSFNDREVWLIAAISINEKGLRVVDDMNEVRKIAEGYANAGIKILKKKIYEEKPDNIINSFEAEIIEILNEIIKND